MVYSAGLCLWRRVGGELEVLIVHPGGPYWAKKDAGAWSFPKGEYDPATEDGLAAARREFSEELGSTAPTTGFVALGETKLRSGKVIHAWAVEGDLDTASISSNHFGLEWPPKSGIEQQFPEVDQAQWCSIDVGSCKLNRAQVVFLERLVDLV